MNGHRVRLAWVILLSSFTICLGISFFIPLGIREYVQRSTRSLSVNVQANQGTIRLSRGENEDAAVFAGEPAQSLDPTGSVLTSPFDQALLIVSTPVEDLLLARAQIYGNSSITVDRATAPRFSASSADSILNLRINRGRMLLTIPQTEDRPLVVELIFPQGTSLIKEPGQYSILSSDTETQLAVLQGEAEVIAGEHQMNISVDQRVIVPMDDTPIGPMDSERDLVINGDFSSGFDEWVVLSPNLEIPEQPTVEVKIDNKEGEPTLGFRRLGIGHADSGIRQIVDEDVTDFDDLRLALSMRIDEQSLGVCGEQGSECPLMVRLDYEDVNGVDQTWLQGFYAQGTAGPTTPDICIACPPPLNEHARLPFGQLSFYESENLLEKLGQLGILPRRIKSITLIASGHTFETEIVDVSLLANE